MARNCRIRVRIEIGPAEGSDGEGGAAACLESVEEEAVWVVAATAATSLDDMEETLLENSYAVMRRALASHFTAVSKGGLCDRRRQGG